MPPMTPQTPTPDEIAQQVVDLLQTDDRAARIERITEHGSSAGMAMLSLAYIASRHVAHLAEQTGATVIGHAKWASGRPMESDDPRGFAILLLAITANDDRQAAIDITRQVLALGKGHAHMVIEILAAMADDAMQTRFLAHQNPHQNPPEN